VPRRPSSAGRYQGLPSYPALVRSAAPILRTFHHAQFDARALADTKAGRTVSVCLPARNEGATVGRIVSSIRRELVDGAGLVDEILVVDDHSHDATATVAAAAGARVVNAADVLPDHGNGHGKGAAMWRSLYESEGDVVVWCDADLVNFQSHFVLGLVGPLLTHADVDFVKGFYDRPAVEPNDRGGRVTELVARPLLTLLFPHLTSIVQPLGGEYAGRRELLEQLPFVEGYGVDIALLIDIASTFGTEVIAQVDLGTRLHRNRPLDELSPQAAAIMQTALARAGRPVPSRSTLVRPGLEPLEIVASELPPIAHIPTYSQVARGA
jgi:glucosyl-3-phosphoglycerate synthase